MTLSTGQVLNGRYRIVKTLDQGGSGAVYRSWDLEVKGPCALIENRDSTPESQERFVGAYQKLCNLRHANLPRVYDHLGVPGQGQYMVMDYVDGEDLGAMLERSGEPLDVGEVMTWLAQICEALAYLHAQAPPIIHGDIQPASMRITPEGRAMLVGFGLAKMFDAAEMAAGGERTITPGYSPPEQYGKLEHDERGDIYSLGASAYHLLTGRAPPASTDITSGAAPAPAPVREYNREVPRQVSEAIEQAMQLSREMRQADILDFKQALTAAYDQPESDAAQVVTPAAAIPAQPAPAVAPTEVVPGPEPGAQAVPATQVLPGPHPVAEPVPAHDSAEKTPRKAIVGIAIGCGVICVLVAVAAIFFGIQFYQDQTAVAVEQAEEALAAAQTEAAEAIATATGSEADATPEVTYVVVSNTPTETPPQTATSPPNLTATALLAAIRTQRALDKTATAQAEADVAALRPKFLEMTADEILANPEQWPVIIQDTFDSNEYGWALGADDSELASYEKRIENGKFVWDAEAKDGFVARVFPDIEEISDFYLDVEAQRISGVRDASFGVILRYDEGNYYVFRIGDDLYMDVKLRKNDQWIKLIPWRQNSAIRSGKVNHITVVGQGNMVTFYINGYFVTRFKEDSVLDGLIGLSISLFDPGDEAIFEFDNFIVRGFH